MTRRLGMLGAATETKLKTCCEGSETALFLSGKAVNRAATPALWCMYLQPIIYLSWETPQGSIPASQPWGQGFEKALIVKHYDSVEEEIKPNI